MVAVRVSSRLFFPTLARISRMIRGANLALGVDGNGVWLCGSSHGIRVVACLPAGNAFGSSEAWCTVSPGTLLALWPDAVGEPHVELVSDQGPYLEVRAGEKRKRLQRRREGISAPIRELLSIRGLATPLEEWKPALVFLYALDATVCHVWDVSIYPLPPGNAVFQVDTVLTCRDGLSMACAAQLWKGNGRLAEPLRFPGDLGQALVHFIGVAHHLVYGLALPPSMTVALRAGRFALCIPGVAGLELWGAEQCGQPAAHGLLSLPDVARGGEVAHVDPARLRALARLLGDCHSVVMEYSQGTLQAAGDARESRFWFSIPAQGDGPWRLHVRPWAMQWLLASGVPFSTIGPLVPRRDHGAVLGHGDDMVVAFT